MIEIEFAWTHPIRPWRYVVVFSAYGCGIGYAWTRKQAKAKADDLAMRMLAEG